MRFRLGLNLCKKQAVVCLAILTSAVSARAEFGEQRFAAQGFVGFGFPGTASNFNSLVGPGPAGGLRLWWYPWSRFGVGVEEDYAAFGSKSSAGAQAKANALNTGLVLRWNFRRGRWTPYAHAGIGHHRLKLSYGAGAAAPASCSPLIGPCSSRTATAREFSYSAGLGGEVFVGEKLSVGLEWRYREYDLGDSFEGFVEAHSLQLALSYALGAGTPRGGLEQ